jgi:hypothetical protein
VPLNNELGVLVSLGRAARRQKNNGLEPRNSGKGFKTSRGDMSISGADSLLASRAHEVRYRINTLCTRTRLTPGVGSEAGWSPSSSS